jgi:DNA-binding CsgD family transcriptional regulator
MSQPSFVGRDREITTVAQALDRPPALVLIEGEAGIGKSRMLREILALRPEPSLLAGCLPFPDPFTLGPLVDAIRQATDRVDALQLSDLAGALRPLFPEWSADLPPAPEAAEDPTAARHRLFRALCELLQSLSVQVFVVEDAHWADQATLEFLLFVAARQPHPLGLVVTYRAEDVPADSLLWRLLSRAFDGLTCVQLTLAALDVDEVAALVSSMLQGEYVSREFAAFLHRRTDGVPLALEESVRLMGERADLARRGGEWVRRRLDEIQVPATIRDSVLERVDRLGPDARAVSHATAVLTDPGPDDVVAAVAGLPIERARAGLAAAMSAGLLHEDARRLVSFRHTLAARAVYEAIPAPHRRALHLRTGRALEAHRPLPLPQLARHLREAGETADWRRYGEQAADLAIASGDEATAAGLLVELITTADLAPDSVAELALKLPLTVMGASRHASLIARLRAILHGDGLTPRTEAEIRYMLARSLLSSDEHGAACAELERAIPGLVHDPAASQRAMTLLAMRGGAVISAPQRLRWLQRAAAVPVEPADAGARLRNWVDRVGALLHLAQEEGWTEAARLPDTAESAQERLQLARAALNLGDAALIWGRYTVAGERLGAALELAARYGYDRLHGEILATQAHLDWCTGRWNGLAERAESLAADEDLAPLARLEVLGVVGMLHAARGDQARADDCLVRAVDETRRRSALESTIEPAAALATSWLRADRVGDAVELTEEPVRLMAEQPVWQYATDIVPARVAALIVADRLDEATALVAAFGAGLGELRAPAAQAALGQCRAMLAAQRGEHARAAELFAVAVAAWEALPRPYSALLAREGRGACLIAGGARSEGVDVLGATFQGLTALGASGDAERVAHALRGLGVPMPRIWRGGRRGYGDELSPRELDVVRLVAAGRTNRQIAQALSRSIPTVASQLRSAMRKLGAASRTAVAAHAIEAGLLELH